MECMNIIKMNLLELVGEWQWAKSFVYPVMRTDKENADEYNDMPSTIFLNLKVYYKVLYPLDGDITATVKITNAILEKWGITVAELQEKAMKNLKDDGYQICDMLSVLRDMFGEAVGGAPIDWKSDMYVLTNRRKSEGAAGLLNIGLIGKFAEKRESDLYILPSSIQETILIPFDAMNSVQDLKEMVTEINETQVEENEQLGNSIYAYSRESGKIYIALQ